MAISISYLEQNFQPLLRGETSTIPLADVLLALARSQAVGVLHLEPSGLRLHLRQGYLDAIEGIEPLGSVLVRMGMVERKIMKNLEPYEPIGQTLLRLGKLDMYSLRLALDQQARRGLAKMLKLPLQNYVFFPHEPLPQPTANLCIPKALLEAVIHLPQ